MTSEFNCTLRPLFKTPSNYIYIKYSAVFQYGITRYVLSTSEMTCEIIGGN